MNEVLNDTIQVISVGSRISVTQAQTAARQGYVVGPPRTSISSHLLAEMVTSCMRLDEAPGVGPVLATAVVATVADPKSVRSGRSFSAWIGSVPKQRSSGGKNRLGNISKQGDRYRGRRLAVIRYAKIHGTKHRPWLTALLALGPTKVAAIALAHKLARMVWAMMVKGERYKEPVALAS
jgi:transposase